MDREERRRKRQQDTRNAMIAFLILMIVAAALIVGVVYMANRYLSEKKNAQDNIQTEETENLGDTEDAMATGESEQEPEPVDPWTEQAKNFVAGMTLEDKIAQMFMITPNALTGYTGVTAAGDTTKEFYNKRPVGGIIYMGENLVSREQTTTMLTNMQAIAKERTGLPAFLGVDEEGGTVARIAKNDAFGVTNVGNMSDIGATGDTQNAYNAGAVIGNYLRELGFNLDFAPVADVLTNPDNTVIGVRSFGSDSQLVADMVVSELQGLSDQGIYGAVKHFPGHGGTSEDSHEGAAVSNKTLDELLAAELVPFQKAIEAGTSFVMVGHISLPNVTGDNVPASLSATMVTTVLREQMGYNG
ncbi:MAG: glycoside hydrolase family 3 protein, partial [Roseburia sp.]|nr:glycoside hydrolase family 3 protein [Roseburia sp.]